MTRGRETVVIAAVSARQKLSAHNTRWGGSIDPAFMDMRMGA